MTDSNFASFDQIATDLFGNNASPAAQKQDQLIKSLIPGKNRVLQNLLTKYADSLPYANSSVTADLTQAANLLVEKEWHRIKSHWDDVDGCKKAFDEIWNSVETYLKNLPTARTKPQAVSASFASDSTLLKNIPGVTDQYGNTLTSL